MPGNNYTANKTLTSPGADAHLYTNRAIASRMGWLAEFGLGGQATTSTAARYHVGRASTNGITPTNLTATKVNPFTAAATLFATGSWATPPVLPAGDEGLFKTGWNGHGGIIRWLAAPGQEFVFMGTATSESEIVHENVDASGPTFTAWCMWGE